ncbi:MAG: penicillin-binding protein 1A [Limisphaerales bacterium]|jgi:penicillin-binding protein 1A
MWVLSKSDDIPDIVELQNPQSYLASEVYSADGEVIGKYYRENRSNAKFEELPVDLRNALVATEDVRFRKHAGVDARAIARVAVGVITFNPAGGGSTLTQQLAKNLYPRERDLSSVDLVNRKFKEWILAARLEKNFTKDEILTLYLNTVPFMYAAYGVKACAKTYFGKDISDLSTEESATIVGMLKNPSLYNPVRRVEKTRSRRNDVFYQMTKYGYLDEAKRDSLCTLELDISLFKRQDHNSGMATYFREQLRLWMNQWCKDNLKSNGEPYNVYKDGLKITTTLDSRMQRYAEEAVVEWMTPLQESFFEHWGPKYRHSPWTYPGSDRRDPKFLEKKMKRSERYRKLKKAGKSESEIKAIFEKPIEMKLFSWEGDINNEIDTVLSPMDSLNYISRILHAGMMALDPKTGYIRAWVGGVDHLHFKYDHVNKNTRRQVGSTFKPFIYTTALQAGYYPCKEVPNVPVTFHKGDSRWGLLKDWTPGNSGDDKEGENVTLYWALANSVNYVSAYLMDKVGSRPVIDMTKKMGVEAEIPDLPSICLGTPEISLYEMVGAYTIFANKGGYTQPVFVTKIEDKNGVILYEHFGATNEEVMKPEDAYVMLKMLQNVVQEGTAVRLHRDPYGNIPWDAELAGKTGTTQQHSDGWFMGIAPKLVSGVWVGADDPVVAFRTIDKGQGANMALPIFGKFLSKVYADKSIGITPEDKFSKPSDLKIELDCGKYIQDEDGNEIRAPKEEDPYDEFM